MARRGAGTPFLRQLSLLLLLHLGGECGLHPVLGHGHTIPSSRCPLGQAGTAGTGRMGPGTCPCLAQRSALPLQSEGPI